MGVYKVHEVHKVDGSCERIFLRHWGGRPAPEVTLMKVPAGFRTLRTLTINYSCLFENPQAEKSEIIPDRIDRIEFTKTPGKLFDSFGIVLFTGKQTEFAAYMARMQI